MSPQLCTINGAGLERVRYFTRQLITADDMLAEQQYFRQKLRRHNRFLHGWGVVCGMGVTAAPDATKKLPWRVKIDAGYALGPYGDEIYLSDPFCFDLSTCQDMVPDPCEPGEPPRSVPPRSGKLFLAIRYLECESRPVRVHPLGCACEDTLCEYSRIQDDFQVGCVPELPIVEIPPLCDLLGRKQIAPCPPCPESQWVVLAEITLPDPSETPLTDAMINNFVRRQLFSTAMLQQQLIKCCCEEPSPPPPPPPPPPPARVTSVDPANNALFTNAGPPQIEITFNKDLKPASVNPNTVIVTRSGTKVPGNVTFNSPSKKATFKPNALLGVGDYKITVLGNGPQHVIDVDNLPLDGDANGTAGGDFSSKFLVQQLG